MTNGCFLPSFIFFLIRVARDLSILLIFPVCQLLVLLINSTAVSNWLISSSFFIKFPYNHTILPLADGLFDMKSVGTGVSLWRCVISNRETTKAKRKYFPALHPVLLGGHPRALSELSVALPDHSLCPGLSSHSVSHMKCWQQEDTEFTIKETAGTGWPQAQEWQALGATIHGLFAF